MSENPSETTTSARSIDDILNQLRDDAANKRESPRRTHERVGKNGGVYPTQNLAVDICDGMFASAVQEALDGDKGDKAAMHHGKIAYCAAMPKLAGATNIRDFIACVTYAMALEILSGPEGTRLLYAAQVAHTALTKRPKKRNKTSHTNTRKPDPIHL